MIKIDDASEKNFLNVFLRITGLTTSNEYVWIGLSDIQHEGKFVWQVDNSTVNFTSWAPRQPDNRDDMEDCVVVGAEKYFGFWKDQVCDRWFLYICEQPANGIACFQCSSGTSFADCETQQVVVNCSFPQNYCSKEKNSTQDNDEQAAVFYKGCTSADRCTQEMKDTVECCENNLCNKDITCYHCTSNASFADCARKQTEVTCTLPRNRCVKVGYSSSGNYQTFYKGCTTTKDCEATSDKSFVECCDDNLCNKESELSCFKCSSTVSHDECQKRRQEHVCRSSKDDRCYYASMQQTSQDGSSVTKHFEYGCTNNLHCNNTGKFLAGCDESSNACQVRCCGKNLCNEVAATQEEEPFKVNSTIAYASMATVAGLVLLCFITGFCFYRKSRRKQMERSARNGLEIIALDKWEILPEEIEYEEELGRGAFGVVYKATLKKRQGIEIFYPVEKVHQNNTIQVVAVKELQVDSSEEQVLDFLNEISQMKLLAAHPNIVSLVGCSTLGKHKFLVLEYVPYGDLLEWLRKKRQSINQYLATEEKGAENSYEEREPQSNQCQQQGKIKPSQLVSTETTEQGKVEENDFSTRQLLSFAAQVARGMNHLADRGFVHRDLAARNVLVGDDDRVKVSDFGLMRQLYEDVYTIKKTKKLPIKWMAPESIYYSVFTTKSDVWSYGVLLWEMATMGGVPYPTLTNSQLCKLLRTGYLMGRPDMCSDEVYDLMTECWREDPTTRPSFSGLIGRLEEIMTKDVPYCDLNNYDETSPWYSAALETSEETE
ncbi:receptor-type tyrosine-protein kinase FLT3-like [Stylophora pistillata]|uniref:receptor-type tyrosine-protein kinase FLT3-like n=1 Tax=Stylophora pistillata TaxID=50429 RepID=UPI000C042952|nr:receptor-type tyrosine-protein kinase FLT3-like [Stylophora pistillata]